MHTVCRYVSVTFPLRQEERLTRLVHIIHMLHGMNTPEWHTHRTCRDAQQPPRASNTPNLSRTNNLSSTNQLAVRDFLFKICRLIGYFGTVMSKKGFYDSNLSCGFMSQNCIILCHLEMILAWFWWDFSFRLCGKIHNSAEMLWWLCYTWTQS